MNEHVLTHGSNGLGLLQAEGSCEFLSQPLEVLLGRFNVEEGERRRLFVVHHQVRHGAQPDMIWLTHEHIPLWEHCSAEPLDEGIWPVQHYIPAHSKI